MKNIDTITRLAALDPEPASHFSNHDRQVKARLFENLVSAPETSHRRSPIGRARLVAAGGLCGLLIVGLAASIARESPVPSTTLAIGTQPLSAADLAGWTAIPVPSSPDSPVEQNCSETLSQNSRSPGPVEVLSSDLRGVVGSVVVAKGDDVAWCVGTDNIPTYILLESAGYEPTLPQADSITFGPGGARLPPHGYGFALGRVGANVESVVMHEDGQDVTATISNGYWSAWWPSDTDATVVDGSFTIETKSGDTNTSRAEDLRGYPSN